MYLADGVLNTPPLTSLLALLLATLGLWLGLWVALDIGPGIFSVFDRTCEVASGYSSGHMGSALQGNGIFAGIGQTKLGHCPVLPDQ